MSTSGVNKNFSESELRENSLEPKLFLFFSIFKNKINSNFVTNEYRRVTILKKKKKRVTEFELQTQLFELYLKFLLDQLTEL